MKQTGNGSLSSAVIIVMSSMILSRLTGFLRETILSWKVGLSWVQDAYVAAFTVPDLVYMLLVGGTISAALVPFLSGKLERCEEEEGWLAASTFINIVFLGMVIVCGLGIVFAPQIIPSVAPGFSDSSPQTLELAVKLSRILFPSVSFIMMAGICNGVLNSYRKFAAAAFGPSIYNLGCTLSIFLFADADPDSMIKVAIFVALSAFLYFLIQFLFSHSKFKFYKPVILISDKGFRKLFSHAVPSLLSSSITQVNSIISTAFVSLSAIEGSLAAFRNANTLWQLPYGIFAMGIGTAVLPSLSRKYAVDEHEEYKSLLMKSLTSVLFLAVPSAVGFIVLRTDIVRAVFKWGGRFTEENVPFVASILALFCISMITQSTVAIMNRAYYARQDTMTPLAAGIVSIILNILLGMVFHLYTDLGASGMALSYSIISLVNSILLLILLNKKMKGIQAQKLGSFLIRTIPSAAVMAAFLLLIRSFVPDSEIKLLQLLYLLLEIIAGALIYIIMMLLMKSQDAIYLMKNIRRRLKM
ncbi:MAG: murein biosynthesis integral membrane protein MurJ [Clostridiaceae bacterium]|nr:murein biosynthesis integral membrane protein MurJ [Clostridiaceae bacterium]